ncbi:MAG: glycosyltransferase family 39 protein [Azonexus sp.]|jgi:4-amino-4-deoxy-L-arabinose transferase-like glycosyltransferase|uniref:glycosyltransferase family 39 protein n=1 Tax=Azonexus sp. TaxID=1872668 RepID=UPI002830C10A|nr:glycosyltransferase family 39 protein [Azonexus sp.]MDR0775199.1 glycosyltransferase family 39 protein [Azonexus sp.]
MESSTLSRRTFWLLLLAVAAIWFGNIEHRKIIPTDEGRYAEIAREMAASGDWVTPRLNDIKYFEKPPLQYWATATAYEIFGVHQWTARLWVALTGFAGVLLVGFAGKRLFGPAAGFYAAMLLGSSQLYVQMAHINTLDMGVTFFLTLGIVSLLLAQQEVADAGASGAQGNKAARNWMWLAWIALALAMLSKGLMGPVLPGAALFLYCVFQRDWSVWKRMHWGIGLLLFLLVSAPWFYLVMQANPEFFQKFFIYEHWTRFTTKELDRYQPWHYFIPILLFGMLPWTLLMFDTVLRAWKNSAGRVGAFNPVRFLLFWSGFVYVFFSVSGSKLPSYLLPMLPALALLMGRQLTLMTERRLFWLIAPTIALPLLIMAAVPFSGHFARTPLRQQLYAEYALWLGGAALCWLVGTIAALLLLRRTRKMAAVLALALGSLIAAQLAASGYNTIARERSSYLLADAVRPYMKPDMPFYAVGMYDQTLPFYLNRTLTLVDNKEKELNFGIAQEPWRVLPDLPSLAQAWQAQPEAMAIMPLRYYPLLEQEGLAMKILYQNEASIVVSKP